eukprot:COSAG06_NODE_51991_length_308_cov_1.411483_2_plen_42_part_01
MMHVASTLSNPQFMNFKIRLTARDGRDGCLVVTLLLSASPSD